MLPRQTLSIAAMTLLAACSSKEQGEPGAHASASASAAKPRPSASASAAPSGSASAAPKEGPAAPKWVSTVPPRPISAKPGDRVWAVLPVPGQETASFGVLEVDSAQGPTATTW